jgi:CheY-like chemotaxis protein
MILYFASDLLWASKIKATADAAGIPARPVRSVAMLEARLADSAPRALLLDLDNPQVAMELLERARREVMLRLHVLAWGPHVEQELFQRARGAGADEVLTRGAFHEQLDSILRRLSGV